MRMVVTIVTIVIGTSRFEPNSQRFTKSKTDGEGGELRKDKRN